MFGKRGNHETSPPALSKGEGEPSEIGDSFKESLRLSLFEGFFVRNSKFLAAFLSAARQNPAAIGGCHSLTETVLVLSFSLRRLECTFHRFIVLTLKIRAAKLTRNRFISKLKPLNPLKGT